MKTASDTALKAGNKHTRTTPNRRRPQTELRRQLEMFERIFDCIYHGVMVTDAEGYVTHFHKVYRQFLGLDPGVESGRAIQPGGIGWLGLILFIVFCRQFCQPKKLRPARRRRWWSSRFGWLGNSQWHRIAVFDSPSE